jgi:hypothetical protein
VALLALAACGGGDSDPSPDAGDPATVELRGQCALDEHWGGFAIEAGADFSSISGKVEDGVQPVRLLEETLVDGDCRLLRRPNPQCDPACTAAEVCDLDDTCVPQPTTQDVGEVTLAGLVDEVAMTPVEPGNNYFATGLSHPVFDPGALVTLTSTAGRYGELRLNGVGPESLTVLGDDWTVRAGAPLTVSWNAPAAGVRTTVRLELNIDQHGLTPVTVVCELADTGTATVSATIVDGMFDAGSSGFPRGSLTRRTVDSQSVDDGCIELVVATPRSHTLRVQ